MIVILLIAATAIVSIMAFSNSQLFYRLALSYYDVVERRQFYRLLAHIFVHGSWGHLLINMLVFYSFGSAVANIFESMHYMDLIRFPNLQFLALYLGGGITAGLFSLLLRRERSIPSVGASGGVAALVFTSIFFDPWARIYIFGLVPLPGIILGAAYLAYSWYMGKKNRDNIDHYAHFAGAVYGFFYPLLIDYHLAYHFVNQLFQLH